MRHPLAGVVFGLASLIFWGLESSVEAEQANYFRVSSVESTTSIASLTTNGWLSWNSTNGSAKYVIERVYDLSQTNWAPITRGWMSNMTASVKVFDLNPPGPNMVFIPGGTFLMGNTNDATQFADPVFQATVSPYFISKFEVTVADFAAVYQWAFGQGLLTTNAIVVTNGAGLVTTNYYIQNLNGVNLFIYRQFDSEINFTTNTFWFRPGRGQFPAHYMTWYGAVSYCNWAGTMQGLELCYNLNTWECDYSKRGYRLPTEAEWEFAARGGYEQKRFPWAHKETITHSDANYQSDTNKNWYDVSPTQGYHPNWYGIGLRPGSSPVGYFAPNNYGLYDMCGNVWEWTGDWYEKYTSTPKINPKGPPFPTTGTWKVFRGGAWRTTAERNTCAVRYLSAPPTSTVNDVGFRLIVPYIQ